MTVLFVLSLFPALASSPNKRAKLVSEIKNDTALLARLQMPSVGLDLIPVENHPLLCNVKGTPVFYLAPETPFTVDSISVVGESFVSGGAYTFGPMQATPGITLGQKVFVSFIPVQAKKGQGTCYLYAFIHPYSPEALSKFTEGK